MELRDFISTALLDIVGAVQDAQAKTPTGTIVPDDIVDDFKAVETGISDVQSIEFEVTVSADKRSGSEGKLSVVAAVVGGGIKGESSKSDGHAASLKFRIPVRLPSSKPSALANAN